MNMARSDRTRPRREKRPSGVAHQTGYGKPPQSHQFKPGQSGNPRGRPKGTKNETTILRELLDRKIEVREGGRARKITIMEAILLRFTEDALKGNTKTAAFLFSRYALGQTGEADTDELSSDDRKVLDDFVERVKKQIGQERKKP